MITFDPLWRTLKSKGLNKGDLQKIKGLSSSTIAKLSDRVPVTVNVPCTISE